MKWFCENQQFFILGLMLAAIFGLNLSDWKWWAFMVVFCGTHALAKYGREKIK